MLRRRVLLSAVVGLLFAIAAGVLGQAYASGLPDEYTAETVVIFGSRPTDNGGVTGSDSVQSTAAGYVAYLSAPSTLREIAEDIGEDPAALREGLAVTQLPATATIRVNYTTGDPDRAARGANALGAAVTTRTVSDPLVYAQVLARAAVPLRPSGPPRTILLAVSVVVAVVVGAGAATATWSLSALLARRRTGAAAPARARVATSTPAASRVATSTPAASRVEAPARGETSGADPEEAEAQAVRARLASITSAVAARRRAEESEDAVDEEAAGTAGLHAAADGPSRPAEEASGTGATEDGDGGTAAEDDGEGSVAATGDDTTAEDQREPDVPAEGAVDADAPEGGARGDTGDGLADAQVDAEEPRQATPAPNGAAVAEGSAARPAPRPGNRRGPRRRTSGRGRKPR